MKFNKVIYQRLQHIACFMPDKMLPDSPEDPMKEAENMYCRRDFQEQFLAIMRISEFEYKLFELCVIVFRRLEELFLPYTDKVPCYIYSPVKFMEYVKENSAFSKEKIQEQSFGMFRSN